jgi:hypothetical protein
VNSAAGCIDYNQPDSFDSSLLTLKVGRRCVEGEILKAQVIHHIAPACDGPQRWYLLPQRLCLMALLKPLKQAYQAAIDEKSTPVRL